MRVLLWFTVKYLFNCTNERVIFWAINEGREIVRAMVKIYFIPSVSITFCFMYSSGKRLYTVPYVWLRKRENKHGPINPISI